MDYPNKIAEALESPTCENEATTPVNRRRRGGLLIDIILGFLLLGGLLYGAYSYFQQGSTSGDLATMNSRFVALSAEVRAQNQHLVNYPTTITAANVRAASTMPEAHFRNVAIAGSGGNTFTITITNIDEVVCTRLQNADLGPRSAVAAGTDCSGGALAVEYLS